MVAGGAALTALGVVLGAAVAGGRRRPTPVIAPERLVRPDRPDHADHPGEPKPGGDRRDAGVAGGPPVPSGAGIPARWADSPPDRSPTSAKSRRRTGRLLGVVLIVGLVVATVVVAIWVGRQDVEPADGQEAAAPTAAEWDPALAELAVFVEDERGLEFDEAVPVDFLASDDYDAEAAKRSDGADEAVALLRAFGLVQGEVDPEEAGNRLLVGAAFGFYDPRRQRIVMLGDDLDVAARATLVHELTLALHDQHFPGLFGAGQTAGQRFGARALVEGDALRMEYAFIDSLEDDDQDDYEAARAERAEASELPETVTALMGAPFSLGDPFVYFLEANGDDVLADAFASPPTSEEQVLDPFRYLDADPPDLPDPPAAPADAEVLAQGDFGAAGWLAVLGERIDPWQALDAVDGWRGDAYTLSRGGRGVCADVVLTGDTENDAAELQSAVAAWAAALPAVSPAVTRVGGTITMTACDPGAGVELGLTGQGAQALILPAARTFTAADELARGRSPDQARCYADDLLRRYSLEELEALDAPDDFQDRMAAADAACNLT